jgi:hypothetical protein
MTSSTTNETSPIIQQLTFLQIISEPTTSTNNRQQFINLLCTNNNQFINVKIWNPPQNLDQLIHKNQQLILYPKIPTLANHIQHQQEHSLLSTITLSGSINNVSYCIHIIQKKNTVKSTIVTQDQQKIIQANNNNIISSVTLPTPITCLYQLLTQIDLTTTIIIPKLTIKMIKFVLSPLTTSSTIVNQTIQSILITDESLLGQNLGIYLNIPSSSNKNGDSGQWKINSWYYLYNSSSSLSSGLSLTTSSTLHHIPSYQPTSNNNIITTTTTQSIITAILQDIKFHNGIQLSTLSRQHVISDPLLLVSLLFIIGPPATTATATTTTSTATTTTSTQPNYQLHYQNLCFILKIVNNISNDSKIIHVNVSSLLVLEFINKTLQIPKNIANNNLSIVALRIDSMLRNHLQYQQPVEWYISSTQQPATSSAAAATTTSAQFNMLGWSSQNQVL